MLLIRLVDGTMATLANQGVAETLRINLSGNNAFVIAYAVANLWTPLAIMVLGDLIEHKVACDAKADILDNNSCSSFTPSPPPISSSLAFFTQPTLLPEVLAKLLYPIANPLPFAYERGHPSCVVKHRSQSKERDNGGQLMEEQECRYMSQRCIDQWRSVALQEFGQARSDADDSRAGLLGGFWLDIIRLGRES